MRDQGINAASSAHIDVESCRRERAWWVTDYFCSSNTGQAGLTAYNIDNFFGRRFEDLLCAGAILKPTPLCKHCSRSKSRVRLQNFMSLS